MAYARIIVPNFRIPKITICPSRMEGALSVPLRAALRREAAKNDSIPCLPLASFARNHVSGGAVSHANAIGVRQGLSEDGKTSLPSSSKSTTRKINFSSPTTTLNFGHAFTCKPGAPDGCAGIRAAAYNAGEKTASAAWKARAQLRWRSPSSSSPSVHGNTPNMCRVVLRNHRSLPADR